MTAKSLEKSALACVFGVVIGRGALPLLFLQPKTGADELMDPIPDEKVTFAELSINVVAWISVPNEAYDFHKKLTISPEPGITCLKERERRAAHLRVF
jgi:hypothetical protein